MTGNSSPEDISTRLQRIAKLAREDRKRALQTLAHHIDVEFLREAYGRTRRDAAVGADGQTWAEYGEGLEQRLQDLLNRFKSGRYFAPPVRRVHIPKGDGRSTRPIGIPTLEDKVLQRAVQMVMGAVYEQDFLDCSWGFRPGRSAHGALKALHGSLTEMGGGWVLDVDIKSFFDSLDHGQLRGLLDRRIRDGVLRRTIDKWLKAGVLEDGQLKRPESGTPQGGVISPLLANIYLHGVLDEWYESEIQPRLSGRGVLVRYADDFVLVFSNEADAHWVRARLAERLSQYGLSLHPTKTRLVRFYPRGKGNDPGGSQSFDFLGFTHHWERSGTRWAVRRKTSSSRFGRTLLQFATWLRSHLHRPVDEQHVKIVKVLQGHDNYYGFRENYRALRRLRYEMTLIWRLRLSRRTRGPRMTWEAFQQLLRRHPFPRPRLRMA